MIVRILGEGQYEVPDADTARLFELDRDIDGALAAGDADAFASVLAELIEAVRGAGKAVPNDVIVASDLVLPYEGTSLAEVAELLASEDVDS